MLLGPSAFAKTPQLPLAASHHAAIPASVVGTTSGQPPLPPGDPSIPMKMPPVAGGRKAPPPPPKTAPPKTPTVAEGRKAPPPPAKKQPAADAGGLKSGAAATASATAKRAVPTAATFFTPTNLRTKKVTQVAGGVLQVSSSLSQDARKKVLLTETPRMQERVDLDEAYDELMKELG